MFYLRHVLTRKTCFCITAFFFLRVDTLNDTSKDTSTLDDGNRAQLDDLLRYTCCLAGIDHLFMLLSSCYPLHLTLFTLMLHVHFSEKAHATGQRTRQAQCKEFGSSVGWMKDFFLSTPLSLPLSLTLPCTQSLSVSVSLGLLRSLSVFLGLPWFPSL